MNNAKLDIGYRDFCAHLLIPLNECRRAAFYMPWSCGEVGFVASDQHCASCICRSTNVSPWTFMLINFMLDGQCMRNTLLTRWLVPWSGAAQV
jgi:NADH-ubiquinone oxidoreductase B18 subunit (NDUFB7)